MHKITERKIT